MPDLIPEGCISLSGAYDLFAAGLWNGHSPLADLLNENIYRNAPPIVAEACRASLANVTTQMLAEMVHAFSTGALDALVRAPGAHENSAIPEPTWKEVFFPERLFLSSTIVHHHGGYWDALVGRTPFVRRTQLNSWIAARMERRRNPDAMGCPADRALTDHLGKLAANGLVSSSEVETAAQEWGLEAFASKPPPDEFDPMREANWTLCMTISWIVWGDINEVRDAMDRYRAKTWHWVSYRKTLPIRGQTDWYEIHGEEVQTLGPLSLSDLSALEACNEDDREFAKRKTVRRAREELWQCLGEGAIEATGIDQARRVAKIPAREWGYLELATRRNGADYLVFSHENTVAVYDKITVPRVAVIAHWPAAEQIETAKPTANVAAILPRRDRKLAATLKAIAELYAGGIPPGLSAKSLRYALNDWLHDNGHQPISATTLRRALRALAAPTPPTRAKSTMGQMAL